MRLLLQRVRYAQVHIDGRSHASIGPGLLALVGIAQEDTREDIHYLVGKMLRLRIFEDEQGRMNLSVQDIQGECLVVSQFTLMADTAKGNRPGYSKAAAPAIAEPLYQEFLATCREAWPGRIQAGVFGADMQITLLNDGPVTIAMESRSSIHDQDPQLP
ncbi:MAG: D-tyrosyl-tRNA(Tyr) deacylase [Sphingomonadales bacterium]|nr:D-tyrosyl-tRNA(Tyr) deacylase [Sphingomonadales bacterium]MBM3924072.1 D-tyrosyl-tRNA(Tyr) deacylase [Sphingomonadales bacterium]